MSKRPKLWSIVFSTVMYFRFRDHEWFRDDSEIKSWNRREINFTFRQFKRQKFWTLKKNKKKTFLRELKKEKMLWKNVFFIIFFVFHVKLNITAFSETLFFSKKKNQLKTYFLLHHSNRYIKRKIKIKTKTDSRKN